MKNFLLVPNFKRNSLPYVERTVAFLRQNHCNLFCQKEDDGKFDATVCTEFSVIDCILVFGGDGTMLKAIKRYLSQKKPFVGINTGRVGYLSDIEPEKVEKTLAEILSGNYIMEERVTLRVDTPEGVFYAVNEAVLHRSTAHVLGIDIDVNDQRVEPVRADGILVATPTGSTAYNLSAGGPILMPTSKNMVATPICAHSLTARPVVIGSDDVISLTVSNCDEPAFINVDGDNIGSLPQSKSITIAVSEETFTLLRLAKGSFFTVLRNKLSTWEQ